MPATIGTMAATSAISATAGKPEKIWTTSATVGTPATAVTPETIGSTTATVRDVMDGSKIRDPAETIHGCQQ
jgi:hypothetical protein